MVSLTPIAAASLSIKSVAMVMTIPLTARFCAVRVAASLAGPRLDDKSDSEADGKLAGEILFLENVKAAMHRLSLKAVGGERERQALFVVNRCKGVIRGEQETNEGTGENEERWKPAD